MQVLCFIALIDHATADELVNKHVVVRCEERGAEAVEGLLDALVAHAMGLLIDHRP
jgi:hypothetical protein